MFPTTWKAIPGVARPPQKIFAVKKKLKTHPDSERNGTEWAWAGGEGHGGIQNCQMSKNVKKTPKNIKKIQIM